MKKPNNLNPNFFSFLFKHKNDIFFFIFFSLFVFFYSIIVLMTNKYVNVWGILIEVSILPIVTLILYFTNYKNYKSRYETEKYLKEKKQKYDIKTYKIVIHRWLKTSSFIRNYDLNFNTNSKTISCYTIKTYNNIVFFCKLPVLSLFQIYMKPIKITKKDNLFFVNIGKDKSGCEIIKENNIIKIYFDKPLENISLIEILGNNVNDFFT